jgi:hypothetical protein
LAEGDRSVSRKLISIDQIVAILDSTPRRLSELTLGLAPEELHRPPAPGAWSANEVLAHLRACADVWGSSMRRIIVENSPTIRAINPRAWIERTDYRELPFQTSLDAFTAQRVELLALLGPLPDSAWQRSATATGAGAQIERTVHAFGHRFAHHEGIHVNQIANIVGTLRS